MKNIVMLFFLMLANLSFATTISYGIKSGYAGWLDAPIVSWGSFPINNDSKYVNGFNISGLMFCNTGNHLRYKLSASYVRSKYYDNPDLPYCISIYLNRITIAVQPEWYFQISKAMNPYFSIGPAFTSTYMDLHNNGVMDFWYTPKSLVSIGVSSTLGNEFIIIDKLSIIMDLEYTLSYPFYNGYFYQNIYRYFAPNIINLSCGLVLKI